MCECLREDSWPWGCGGGREPAGEGRFIDIGYFTWRESFLAPIAGVTFFTCWLLESWPSSNMGGLSHPSAGPSPKDLLPRSEDVGQQSTSWNRVRRD